MRIQHILQTVLFSSLLAACGVDTTGISADLYHEANPQSNAASPVIVREYSDLQCPSCRGAYLQLNPQLLQKYGKDIRFEFTHFPLQTLHPYALAAAEGAECAADQGKFWEFIDLNYQEQDKLSPAQLVEWAKKLNLDMDLYTRCTTSHIKRSGILAEYKDGVKLGVNGTPTYMVNGAIVPATSEDLSKAIDDALKTATPRL